MAPPAALHKVITAIKYSVLCLHHALTITCCGLQLAAAAAAAELAH
jgi:hypothetical protein